METMINLVGLVGGKVKDSGGAQAPHPRFSFQIWATNRQESLREALLRSLLPKYPYPAAAPLCLTRVKLIDNSLPLQSA